MFYNHARIHFAVFAVHGFTVPKTKHFLGKIIKQSKNMCQCQRGLGSMFLNVAWARINVSKRGLGSMFLNLSF